MHKIQDHNFNYFKFVVFSFAHHQVVDEVQSIYGCFPWHIVVFVRKILGHIHCSDIINIAAASQIKGIIDQLGAIRWGNVLVKLGIEKILGN